MAINHVPYDSELLLEAGTTARTADGNGSAGILDLGSGQYDGMVVIDISAIKITANDELYEIILEGSDSASHASGISEICRYHFGPNEVLNGNTDTDSTTGRYYVPFTTWQNAATKRYVRLRYEISGTSPSITFKAFIGSKSL